MACKAAMQAFPLVPNDVVMERLLDTFQEELDLLFSADLSSDARHGAILRACGLGLLLFQCDKILAEEKNLRHMSSLIDELEGHLSPAIDKEFRQKRAEFEESAKHSLSKFIRS